MIRFLTLLALFPTIAHAGCGTPRIEQTTDYFAVVYNCGDAPVYDQDGRLIAAQEVKEALRDHGKTAKALGFSQSEGAILPDGSGGMVYSYKWTRRH
jgi:hypothetical protein